MRIIKTYEEFINPQTVDGDEKDTAVPAEIDANPGEEPEGEEDPEEEEPADDETIVSFDTDTDTVKDGGEETDDTEDSEEEEED